MLYIIVASCYIAVSVKLFLSLLQMNECPSRAVTLSPRNEMHILLNSNSKHILKKINASRISVFIWNEIPRTSGRSLEWSCCSFVPKGASWGGFGAWLGRLPLSNRPGPDPEHAGEITYLFCCHRDPVPDRQQEMDGWKIMFCFMCKSQLDQQKCSSRNQTNSPDGETPHLFTYVKNVGLVQSHIESWVVNAARHRLILTPMDIYSAASIVELVPRTLHCFSVSIPQVERRVFGVIGESPRDQRLGESPLCCANSRHRSFIHNQAGGFVRNCE